MTASRLETVLQTVFKLPQFRPNQLEIITQLLAKKDILAILPTGGGKSLCYQLPAVVSPGLTIVISPLLSLINDQVTKLKILKIKAAALSSQISTRQKAQILRQIQNHQLKILYLSPEQLQATKVTTILRLVAIKMVVIDEAHCLVEWGNAFRPAYLEISTWIHSLSTRPAVAAFTATATPSTITQLITALDLHQPYIHQQTAIRTNLYIGISVCLNSTEKALNLVQVLSRPELKPMIIYCSSRDTTAQVAHMLCTFARAFPQTLACKPGFYHGGLPTKVRVTTERAFICNQLDVLVATTAFGMGVDKANIRFVCHWQMPASIENFCQEIGRAGRDGASAASLLCYAPDDVLIHHRLLAPLSSQNQQEFKRKMAKLEVMRQLCLSHSCFNYGIASYFGEANPTTDCQRCSNCKSTSSLTVTQRKLLLSLQEELLNHRTNHDQPLLPMNLLVWLSILQPLTEAQLWHVPGMGKGFIKLYGEKILNIIQDMRPINPAGVLEPAAQPLETHFDEQYQEERSLLLRSRPPPTDNLRVVHLTTHTSINGHTGQWH